MFDSVLIANRGEIARRVIATCTVLGIRPVAVHTAADAGAIHVREAATAVEVASYLDIDSVVAAALATGAQAVHPGYGFLSERAEAARAVEKAGLVWIGPSAEVIEAMGRKDAARELAVAAGVPVVPSWAHDPAASDGPAAALAEADFPVLVKAAAGGGGKGMRVVRRAQDLEEAMAAAGREALSAFGDDTLLLEKYVERGRHIEVQVFGDAHGNLVHLHERDCSTQRRHQKVLEEAPAPTLTDAQRRAVHDSAVALARRVGYTNAGTVEFLLDVDASAEGSSGAAGVYFLEMNTRLQVEHPVTEGVVRVGGLPIDLVEWQLRVAAGEPLPAGQDDITVSGHAIEARVYAEDAYAGYLPQAGTATMVRWPSGRLETPGERPGPRRDEAHRVAVRVDHALESGQVVSTGFDPMLGKVIATAPTREAARRGLVEALDATAILGLTTNTGFLRALAAGEEFRDATIDTAWLDRNDPPPLDVAEARRLAAWEVHLAHREVGPFAADGFRLGAPPAPVVVELDEPVTLDGPPPVARPVAAVGPHRVEVVHRGQRWVFTPPDPAADHAEASDGTVVAPMPGTVLEVRAAQGDTVAEGQVVVVLEAMKMELALTAPYAGRLVRLAARPGSQVALGAVLAEVAPDEA